MKMPDTGKDQRKEPVSVYTTYQQFCDRFYKAAENPKEAEKELADLASFGKQLARKALKQT
jgi:hypothetical protein